MALVAFTGGLIVILAALAWLLLLPTVGLLWMLGWLT
jgi:hypothetical protein